MAFVSDAVMLRKPADRTLLYAGVPALAVAVLPLDPGRQKGQASSLCNLETARLSIIHDLADPIDFQE